MRPFGSWTTYDLSSFDAIIDVRSPSEYREDHIPHAINLPVMDDEERARIGVLYKSHPFEANKQGASICSRHISEHLDTYFADKSKRFAPLVYCWRGGMRSASLAIVLQAVGWQTHTLQGGYKGFRAEVRRSLAVDFAAQPMLVLAGPTGSGKTRLLGALRQQGAQVIDLESLAQHRGSLLGSYWWEDRRSHQPSQKHFETRLWDALRDLDPARPVWFESESNKIGRIHIPKTLWDQLRIAPRVNLHTPHDVRIALLIEEYQHFLHDPATFEMLLDKLKPFHGNQTVQHWLGLLHQQRWPELADTLLTTHYDPCYARSSDILFHPTLEHTHTLPDLDPTTLQHAAQTLHAWSLQPQPIKS
jgi:tRNA 2-selenouridine synthase